MTEKKETLKLDFYNPAELLVLKNALVNFKKAPFVSKQEHVIIEELLDRINLL
tara:strand:+ start:781 stop:939 length:159 start_codon:yes stop_codon:yes gene_type:complete